MKTTKWFPSSVNPVRDGVYEVRFGFFDEKLYSRWYRGFWRHNSMDIKYAKNSTKHSYFAYHRRSEMQWRGLAQEPKP